MHAGLCVALGLELLNTGTREVSPSFPRCFFTHSILVSRFKALNCPIRISEFSQIDDSIGSRAFSEERAFTRSLRNPFGSTDHVFAFRGRRRAQDPTNASKLRIGIFSHQRFHIGWVVLGSAFLIMPLLGLIPSCNSLQPCLDLLADRVNIHQSELGAIVRYLREIHFLKREIR